MSVLDRFRKHMIPPNSTFRLTQEGTEKLQNYRGDAKSRILLALETSGTSNTGEIALSSGLSRGAVERMLPSLIRGGYIQRVGAITEEISE